MTAVVSPTVQRSTVEAAPAAEASPENPGAAPPASPGDPGAASAVEAPDPNLEISRRLEKISKHEARTRKAEVEFHEKAAALEEDRKKMAAKLAELDDALGDPVGHMLKIGKDPVAIAKRYAAPETEVEKAVRLIQEERAAEKSASEQKAKEYESEQQEAKRMSVIRAFVSGINEKDHPHFVAMYPDANDVPAMVSKMLNARIDPRDPKSPSVLEHFQDTHEGRSPTDDEIRESLESEAETRATELIKRHQARAALLASQSSVPAQSGPSGISNQHASVTSSGKKRPPTLEEKRRIARKELTEALEAEATDRT